MVMVVKTNTDRTQSYPGGDERRRSDRSGRSVVRGEDDGGIPVGFRGSAAVQHDAAFDLLPLWRSC
jgi:hypothetical protein